MHADPHFVPVQGVCDNASVHVEHPSDNVQVFSMDEDFSKLQIEDKNDRSKKEIWEFDDKSVNLCMCELCYESRMQPNLCTTTELDLVRVLKIDSVFGTDDQGSHDHLLPDPVLKALQVLRKREAEKTRKNVLANAMRETEMTLCSGKSTQDRADIMRERLRRICKQRQGGMMIKKDKK